MHPVCFAIKFNLEQETSEERDNKPEVYGKQTRGAGVEYLNGSLLTQTLVWRIN